MHKGPRWSCRGVALWVLLAVAGCGGAQAQANALDTKISAELNLLAGEAATIFVGQLVSIERDGGVVRVAFRVEQPVRGVVGPTLVLREWAGNWAPGQTRYVLGSRVLGFLHGSSVAGLSSPVHGPEGLVPVVVQGANQPRLLDVRRVAASVVRAAGTPLPDEAHAAVPLDAVLRELAAGGVGTVASRLLPSHARPPKDLLPVAGPVHPSQGTGWRLVQGSERGEATTDARR